MSEYQQNLGKADLRPNIDYFWRGRESTASRPGIEWPREALPPPATRREPHETIIISNAQAVSRLSLSATGAVIVITGVTAGYLYHAANSMRPDSLADVFATSLSIAAIFCIFLRLSSGRQPMKPSSIYERAQQASAAWLMSFGLLLATAFAFKIGADLSRGAVITHFLIGLVAVPASHMNVPIWLARFQKASAFKSRDVILIGAKGNPQLQDLTCSLQRGGCRKCYVADFNASSADSQWTQECKTLLNAVTRLAHCLGPGEIYVALAQVPPERLQSILRLLTFLPRTVLVVPDACTAALLRHPASEIGNDIAVALQQEPLNGLGRAVKRVMDIVLSAAGIVFLAPVLVAIACAIKWESAGPVLFRQSRNGYRGQPFRILKFRTMSVMEDGDVIRQASRNDRRVTRVGKWLRMTSLDELPQLFNVLQGEMSLIGPRPHARAHDLMYAKLIENYEIRQHVKPGITGWAQVNGFRGETQTLDLMRTRIELDLWYARNCGIFLDLRILARTVLEILRPSNAY